MKLDPQEFPARLVRSEPLCEDILGCIFEAADREQFVFEPGQHIRLSLREGAFEQDRYYSIASAPSADNRFELAIQVGDDPGARILRALSPGDELAAWGPNGSFGLREPLRDSIFVATGTGITPLRSMLESALPEANGRRIELIYGARSPERLLYRERWEELAQVHSNFSFTPTVTQPDPGWTGSSGRVQGRLASSVKGRESSVDVYFCGRPEMISECCSLLRERGVEAGSLLFEGCG